MQINEVINIGTAIVLSFGTSSAVLLGLSTWLGKVWANRILEKDKLKYTSELEKTKNEYEKQLEEYKDQLEKSKSMFIRYSESQFNLYNNLWGLLYKLKTTVNDLWNKADFENLRSFAFHLEKTISSIERNSLLIEDEHYEKLKNIFNTLNKFRLNKQNLVRLKLLTKEEAVSIKIDEYIRENKGIKEEFESILDNIQKDFKSQIRIKN